MNRDRSRFRPTGPSWSLLCVLGLTWLLIPGCDAIKEVANSTGDPEAGNAVAQPNPAPAVENPVTPAVAPVETPDPVTPVDPGAAVAAGGPDWKTILGPSQAVLPAPRSELVWIDNLPEALELAKAEKRPLFITLRCPETEDFKSVDEGVLNGAGELGELLRQFVTVRITNLQDFDLRYLTTGMTGHIRSVDLDLSWLGICFSDTSQFYGFVGGRDVDGDQTRVSIPAVQAALQRVLSHHYDPRRAAWNIDLPPVDAKGAALRAEDLPSYAGWLKHLPAQENGCLRCHHLIELHFQPFLENRTLQKHLIRLWPLPENMGLKLNRDDGLLVQEVAPDSTAARMGILPGDVLAASTGASERWKRLISQGDLQTSLENAKSTGQIPLVWLRQGQVMQATGQTDPAFEFAPLTWRRSIIYGNIGANPGFFPRGVKDSVRRTLKLAPDIMLVQPDFGPKPTDSIAYQNGLRGDNLILAANGDRTNVADEAWILWFRQTFEPGQEVILQVKEGKNLVSFKFKPGGRY